MPSQIGKWFGLPFTPRYILLTAAAIGFVACALWSLAWVWALAPALAFLALVVLGVHDVTQARHAILRSYPLSGHFRFLLERIRPEMRQYFFEDDKHGTPFSRDKRALAYQRAKGDSDDRAFGTELDVYAEGYEYLRHSIVSGKPSGEPPRVTIGAASAQPYSASLFNISAMSFGALSANAVRALNGGAKQGGFYHDTGEGGVTPYHRENGGDLVWEIGSGYFGCRDAEGRFNPETFAKKAVDPQIKMIEVKISQGAKPGHGGVLPASKITPEISAIRDVPMGRDCVSPPGHTAFSTPAELLQFVARLRELSGGKPTGFKLCIGHPWEFLGICKAMLETNILPDFIVVDGAEGGTGSAPQEFADHVGMPLREGLNFAHNALVGVGLRDRIRLGASGKIVSAFDVARAVALGADWCNSARGFMFALGCIQSRSCNTDRCPTGVATQDKVRQRALVVPDKVERVRRFHDETLHALRRITAAAGLSHPSQFRAWHFGRRVGQTNMVGLDRLYPTLASGALLAEGGCDDPRFSSYWPRAQAHSFAPAHPAAPAAPAASAGLGPEDFREPPTAPNAFDDSSGLVPAE